jgi:Arc/MetJ-type ribon-helix-helix transcriptional regulator
MYCNTVYYMRAIVNISLPPETLKEVKKEVKLGNYTSVSEYFRDLLRREQAQKLAKELAQERLEFKNGTAKRLRSLVDLT